MGYIIRLIHEDDDTEKKKILEIARKFFKNIEVITVSKYLKELEKKGYVVCRKIKI